MTTLVVVAKQPVPGRVKTRLHPPYTLGQAAVLAHACLHDTLDTLDRVPAARRILFVDGVLPATGKVGAEVTPEEAKIAARTCALNALAAVDALRWQLRDPGQ